jgi:hypothetical protein
MVKALLNKLLSRLLRRRTYKQEAACCYGYWLQWRKNRRASNFTETTEERIATLEGWVAAWQHVQPEYLGERDVGHEVLVLYNALASEAVQQALRDCGCEFKDTHSFVGFVQEGNS